MLILGKAVYKADHQINSANMRVPTAGMLRLGLGPGLRGAGLFHCRVNRQASASSQGTPLVRLRAGRVLECATGQTRARGRPCGSADNAQSVLPANIRSSCRLFSVGSGRALLSAA